MRPLKFKIAAWTFRVQTKCRSTACFAPPHLSYRVYILYIIDIRARGALFWRMHVSRDSGVLRTDWYFWCVEEVIL